MNRLLLERRLMKDGHRVTIAQHGGDAIRALQADATFDLILMDLKCVMSLIAPYGCVAESVDFSAACPSATATRPPRRFARTSLGTHFRLIKLDPFRTSSIMASLLLPLPPTVKSEKGIDSFKRESVSLAIGFDRRV